MRFFFLISLLFGLLNSANLQAQTEFLAGTVTEIPLSGDYTKTGFGFDFKGVSYITDLTAMRIGTGFLSYPSKDLSLLAIAADVSTTTLDSILVSSKIRRQSYRVSVEYLYFLNGGYSTDMNLYTFAGVRLIGISQRYRKGNFDDTLYQIVDGQERNGFDLVTHLNLGFGYEFAIDFFDFVYVEIETGVPLFRLRNTEEVENGGLVLGINFGFRTNFGY